MRGGVLFIPLIILLAVAGCIFDSDDDDGNGSSEVDSGSYSFQVDTDYLVSYPAGAGMILAYIAPDETFAGDVDISIVAPDYITVVPETATLDKFTHLVEIMIYPDSTVQFGMDDLQIIHEHAGISDTASVTVEVYGADEGTLMMTGPGADPPATLVEWVAKYASNFDIQADGSYYRWNDRTTVQSVWHYINEAWDIRSTYNAYPPFYAWFLVRIRGHIDPIMCLRMDGDGQVEEVPTSSFGSIYP